MGNRSYFRTFVIFKTIDKGFGLTSGKDPAGYCKIEARRNRGKIEIYVQDMKPSVGIDGFYHVVLASANSNIKPVKLGIIEVGSDGRGKCNIDFDTSNIEKTGYSLDSFHGIAVAFVPVNYNGAIKYPLAGYSDKKIEISWNTVASGNLRSTDANKMDGGIWAGSAGADDAEGSQIPEEEFDEQSIDLSDEKYNDIPEEDSCDTYCGTVEEELNETFNNITENDEINNYISEEDSGLNAEDPSINAEGPGIKEEDFDSYEQLLPQFDLGDDSFEFDENLDAFPFSEDDLAKGMGEAEGNDAFVKEAEDEAPDSGKKPENKDRKFGTMGFAPPESVLEKKQDDIDAAETESQGEKLTYWDRVKDYYLKLFEKHKKVCPFEDPVAEVDWIRIEHYWNGPYTAYYPSSAYRPDVPRIDHYLIGLVREKGKVRYVAYAIPGHYSIVPPMSMHGFSRWLPLKNGYGAGYWIMYIDCDSGNIVYPY